ncbi:MAG: hypothetical protein UR53_C0008G0006 [Candidatus Magasanikbacteria bacterium GW2011_GWC2_34_16]|uniref:DUF5671 domain-containing protein n=2 Tax=Candidatus Magasanikiibacteriota TaxID=1752731 RepID=A0A0G0HB36_9BACT|nr:MAG: hypothetical protein UR53_C0008G0006 [Candidatus Magasanikbacteria bacterium GW2011_GWC2_34_16]KKQ39357.1 MAG: hypothetical protein US58_C0035G0006 [Candidatus Magasanikbacteria bacterium GW2011_GWA2_37_8]
MEHTNIKSTPKDVFLHLFNIVTFYLSVIGFITLYVQYINATFPDILNYYFSGIAGGVRWATSVLLISVPSYLLTTWMLEKDLKVTPEKRELKLRKWLTYFTLFISAVTIIVDLMVFVYNFLDGGLTMRFFLKVLVVLLVATAVFGYYLWELKRTSKKTKIPFILTIVVLVVVLASIVMGFFIVGTPKDQRNRRFDEQRISDLQIIQNQVVDYWVKKNTLPKNLIDLQDNISGFIVPNDPDSKITYEYNIVSPLAFELCANFVTSDSDFNTEASPKFAVPYDGVYKQNWSHAIGRTCFSRIIDPDLYKDYKAGIAPVVAR